MEEDAEENDAPQQENLTRQLPIANTEFSSIRRLFIHNTAWRKKQALITWQSQVVESPEYDEEQEELQFLVDPFEQTVNEFTDDTILNQSMNYDGTTVGTKNKVNYFKEI